MLILKAEFGVLAAAIYTAVAAAPSEAVSQRESNAVVRNVDPCTVDEQVVPIHKKYGTGLLPKKVEDCIVSNMGPTFMNAFYNSFESTDNSVDINGNRVNIDGSIIGNGNKDNIVGNDNIVGDNNTSIEGDSNTIADTKGDGNIVGTGNGNGNGNIDGSNVNTTNTDNNGNKIDVKDSGNTNSNNNVDIKDNKVDVKNSNNDVKNSGNDIAIKNNDNNALGNEVEVKDNNNNTIGNDGNDVNTGKPKPPGPPYPPTKRDLLSCFSFKCLATVNAVLPCIFAATSTSKHLALVQCGVPQVDICACTGCLPAGIQEYVSDLCGAGSPLVGVPVTDDLADAGFVDSSDNNVRAFLGLLTQSELTAIHNYEKSHARQTGEESSCVLGTRCGGDDGACCLGTCGTLNGASKCFGIV